MTSGRSACNNAKSHTPTSRHSERSEESAVACFCNLRIVGHPPGTRLLIPVPERHSGNEGYIRSDYEGSEAGVSSPGQPNGLSHGIFECLIVEASSQAQNHLSVLADRYTERCRGVFDRPGDG